MKLHIFKWSLYIKLDKNNIVTEVLFRAETAPAEILCYASDVH